MHKLPLFVAGLVAFGTWEARSEAKVDFVKDIQPILQKSCLECHGAEKQKGKLRLDSREAAITGGKDGAALEPGKADKSEFYRRITLPAGNDDVMPNKGDLLPKSQIDLIRDWINQGAEWPAGTLLAGAAKHAESPASSSAEPSKLPDYKPAAAELKAIKALEALGVPTTPIAANLAWRDINFRGQSPEVVAKALGPLKSVLGVYELNLAGIKIKDADLVSLKGLTNLTRLHLENTPITDAGLAHLKGLVNLTYLNLYGTGITDAGLKELGGLTRLKHLYLWQAKTTEAGVASLRQALPQLDISTGVDFKALAKTGENKDEKK